MNWTSVAVIASLFVLLILLKRGGQVSSRAAAEYLRGGALVMDVRSAGEFTAGHLPRAVNLPLSEIESAIGRKVKTKDQVVLLYCQSGARSAEARRMLRTMGYEHAFNMGSYRRAERILGSH
jgi:rhodanese-related sulfurtransferase